MYIVKILFPSDVAFPVAMLIDHRLTGIDVAKRYDLSQETEQVESSLGYCVNRDSFSYSIARQLAGQFLCSVGNGLRYQYTDGFLPDATFVFEYDE